jgi:hypothetical protein
MAGPSIQITIHNAGAVDSNASDPLFIQWDQVTGQDLDLIFGYIKSTGPEAHKWLLPTPQILEDYCYHWRGERTIGCNIIFTNLARKIETGAARLRTTAEWKAYLHSNNRGKHKPTQIPNMKEFVHAHGLLREQFPHDWHKRKISDLTIPERFRNQCRWTIGGLCSGYPLD